MSAPSSNTPKASSVAHASSEAVHVGPLRVEVRTGDLSRQPDIDALLVKVNPWFVPIGHPSETVHLAAGKQLAAALRQRAPLASNQQLTQTGAYDLPQKALFHCLPPLPWRHPMYADDLAARYREILAATETAELESLALEPIGGGARLGSVWSEASLLLASITNSLQDSGHLKRLRILMERAEDANRFRAELSAARVELANVSKGEVK